MGLNGFGSIADQTIIERLESIISAGGGGGGSGISELSEDPSPQLGGNLDLNGHSITVATKFRIKADGTFQLYNSTTSKFHTLTLSGADGAVTIDIAAGEA